MKCLHLQDNFSVVYYKRQQALTHLLSSPIEFLLFFVYLSGRGSDSTQVSTIFSLLKQSGRIFRRDKGEKILH